MMFQVAKNKAWESQYQEQTGIDGIEFPALREAVASSRFQTKSDGTDAKVQDDELKKTQPQRFYNWSGCILQALNKDRLFKRAIA